MGVYNYLKTVGQESALDHGPQLDIVTRKLPEDMLQGWVRVRTTTKNACESKLTAMQKFMMEEREKQRVLE